MALVEHLEKLRHFVRVTNFKSIREAAQATGVSQAGLSKSISGLEEALDTKLFLRSKEGLTLTKEGHEALETAKKILIDATDLETRLRSLKAAKTPKKLIVGMYDSIAVYFGSELSMYLKAVYPTLTLEITADSSEKLLEMVKDGTLDIAIGANFDKVEIKNCDFFKMFDDHYSFYVAPNTAQQESELPLLVHDHAKDKRGQAIEEYLRQGIKERGSHHILNFETLKALTLQGLGIGVMPTRVAMPLVSIGKLVGFNQHKAKMFGHHAIGFLINKNLGNDYPMFAKDLLRLGLDWAKR